jgi:phage terminase small subunit
MESNKEHQEQAKKKKPLSGKNLRFKQEYIACLNGTEAYVRSHPGCTRETARRNASKLLTNADIWADIEAELTKQTMSPNEILRRLTDQAQASLYPFIEIAEDGFVYFDFSHPDAKDHLHVIKRIKSSRSRRIDENKDGDPEVWEDEKVEVELHDSQAALIQLGKYHRIFGEKEPRMNIDLSTLSTRKLERLRNGEDLFTVLTTSD